MDVGVKTDKPVPAWVERNMTLHRALLRGQGFYEEMVSPDDIASLTAAMEGLSLDNVVTSLAPKFTVASLPVVNFLDFQEDMVVALLAEALPEVRARFHQYMTERPLGLGLITAVSFSTRA